MKETLKDKVNNIKLLLRLKTHPACITSEGEISLEMEKLLKSITAY